MSKKTKYHIVEQYVPGQAPKYYLWRTGTKRGVLLEFKLYDTVEEAKVAMCMQISNDGDI